MAGGYLGAGLIHRSGDARGVTRDAAALAVGPIAGGATDAGAAVQVPGDSECTRAGHLPTQVIRGAFVSQARLDHVAGLPIAGPEDSMEPVHGLRSTLEAIPDSRIDRMTRPNFPTREPVLRSRCETTERAPGVVMPVAAMPTAARTIHDSAEKHSGWIRRQRVEFR